MKPWEETWEQHPRAGGGARLYSDNHEEEWASSFGDDSNARVRLAAAAPEMARLLLELEWDHAECNICGGCHRHERNCRLRDVLVRAGVLEDRC